MTLNHILFDHKCLSVHWAVLWPILKDNGSNYEITLKDVVPPDGPLNHSKIQQIVFYRKLNYNKF